MIEPAQPGVARSGRRIGFPSSDRRSGETPPRLIQEIIMPEDHLHGVHVSGRDASLGLVVRQQEPKNLEGPFGQPDSFLTPTELFYIRSHFPTPRLDPSAYRLEIEGAVRSPLALGYDELRRMPAETRVATLECAGNNRVFLVPQVEGAQWGLGAVGNAEWTGVPLAALLERAGLVEDACEIILEGADRGTPKEPPIPPRPISYARSLRRDEAMRREVLIAYQMNGRDLTRDQGYPVRAIVPGHFGMASVKWLTRIRTVRQPFLGYWQTSDYAYWDDVEGQPIRRPLGEIQVKAQIARPAVYETLPPNTLSTIAGAAWSGEAEVTEVTVSTDGGVTWAQAEFIDPPHRHAWRRWRLAWRTPGEPGRYTLLARAKDARGHAQPDQHDPNYGTYVINHPVPIDVFVEPQES
jgi:DMSO/TMAO reductase YedYZ molybdopterin-dependent catalytic subunit